MANRITFNPSPVLGVPLSSLGNYAFFVVVNAPPNWRNVLVMRIRPRPADPGGAITCLRFDNDATPDLPPDTLVSPVDLDIGVTIKTDGGE